MIAEWVSLRPIFKVSEKKTGFEGRGRTRGQWWCQTSVEQHLKTTLKDILEAARDRRQRESGRRGEGEGGLEESDYGNNG